MTIQVCQFFCYSFLDITSISCIIDHLVDDKVLYEIELLAVYQKLYEAMENTSGHRKIEDSLKAELKAAQDLLLLQQKDNYKFQDHVQILEHELDTLHVLVEDKQKTINALKKRIVEKEDAIKDLQKEVRDNKIDRHALKTFESQNTLLLDELKDRMKAMEALEIELRFLKENYEDKTCYSDDRAKRVAAMDIVLTATVTSLQSDLAAAETDIARKADEIVKLKQEVKDLQAGLWQSEERRRDQIARSRQTEYRTLARLQEVSESYFTAEDDKEMLEDTIRLHTSRGESLQRQLDRTVLSLDSSQELFGAVVDHVESRSEIARGNAHQLERENQALQAEIQVLRLTVQKLRAPVPRQFESKDKYDYSDSPYAQKLVKDTERNLAETDRRDNTLGELGSFASLRTMRGSKKKVQLSATTPGAIESSTSLADLDASGIVAGGASSMDGSGFIMVARRAVKSAVSSPAAATRGAKAEIVGSGGLTPHAQTTGSPLVRPGSEATKTKQAAAAGTGVAKKTSNKPRGRKGNKVVTVPTLAAVSSADILGYVDTGSINSIETGEGRRGDISTAPASAPAPAPVPATAAGSNPVNAAVSAGDAAGSNPVNAAVSAGDAAGSNSVNAAVEEGEETAISTADQKAFERYTERDPPLEERIGSNDDPVQIIHADNYDNELSDSACCASRDHSQQQDQPHTEMGRTSPLCVQSGLMLATSVLASSSPAPSASAATPSSSAVPRSGGVKEMSLRASPIAAASPLIISAATSFGEAQGKAGGTGEARKGISSALDWLLDHSSPPHIVAEGTVAAAMRSSKTLSFGFPPPASEKSGKPGKKSLRYSDILSETTGRFGLTSGRGLLGASAEVDFYLASSSLKTRLLERYLSLLALHHRCRQHALSEQQKWADYHHQQQHQQHHHQHHHHHQQQQQLRHSDYGSDYYDRVSNSTHDEEGGGASHGIERDHDVVWQFWIRRCIGYVGLSSCRLTDDDLNQVGRGQVVKLNCMCCVFKPFSLYIFCGVGMGMEEGKGESLCRFLFES